MKSWIWLHGAGAGQAFVPAVLPSARPCILRALFILPACFGARAAFYAEPVSDVLGPLASAIAYKLCIGPVRSATAMPAFDEPPRRKNHEYSRFFDGKTHGAVWRETARRIAAGFGAGRKTTLRVNRLKAEPAQIAAALADAGISARRVPWSEDALVLEGAGEAAVAALPMFENGDDKSYSPPEGGGE